MSSTTHVEDHQFERQVGIGVSYDLTVNTALRIYNVPPQNEILPDVGVDSATLKGGLRVNFLGDVPLLDGKKNPIGIATITRVTSARLSDVPDVEILACGLTGKTEAEERASLDDEFLPDKIVTIFHYRVKSLDNL